MDVLSVLLLLALWASPQGGDHPIPLPPDFDAAKCVECHADKQEGKFVHTAISTGCTSCHQVATEKEQTKITLLAPGGQLCATCHEASAQPVQHWPYQSGHCLACHDPHSSNFPRAMRAETNQVCLSCHGVNQAGVKRDKETQSVKVLGGQTLSFEEYRQAPKIGLDRTGKRGHPVAGHPIDGKDPRTKDAALNCLSCHYPHGSAQRALLPAEVKSDFELCTQCHQ